MKNWWSKLWSFHKKLSVLGCFWFLSSICLAVGLYGVQVWGWTLIGSIVVLGIVLEVESSRGDLR